MLPPELPGVGIDLVEIARMREALQRGGRALRERVFTPAEQASCEARHDPAIHYAARFAAKEAAMKALGTGWGGAGVGFRDLEVLSDGKNPPQLLLHGAAAELARKHQLRRLRISLSHSRETAAAVVVAETSDLPHVKNPPPPPSPRR